MFIYQLPLYFYISFDCLSVCLPVCLSVSLSVCLFTSCHCISIYPLTVCLCVCLSVCLCVCLSVGSRRASEASPYCRTVSVHLCVCPRQLESRVCTQHCTSRATSTAGLSQFFSALSLAVGNYILLSSNCYF